jgi:hypothetical protein
LAWPFERNRKSRRISVEGRLMVNNGELAVRAAVDGLGIACTIEALAEPFLRSGQLVRILEDWSPSFEGLFLYYPGRRQVPATLRALHRHDPHGPRLGAGQTSTPEPFYQGLSESKLRQKSALRDLKNSGQPLQLADSPAAESVLCFDIWTRSMSTTAIDFTPNNSSPRSTVRVVAGTREALVIGRHRVIKTT